MNKKGTFKNKLFRAFILVGILPLIFMAVFSYHNTSKLINNNVNSSIVENVEMMGKLIDTSVGNFINMTEFISKNEDIQQILKKEQYTNYDEKFNDTQKIYKITNSILATQKNDIPIYITGKNKYMRFSTTSYFSPVYGNINGDFFKRVDASDEDKMLYVHRRVDGEDRKDVVISVAKQIKNLKDGEKLGYVVIDIYDDYFDDIFKNAKTYSGNNIFVLDKSGTIITDKLFKNRTGFKFYDEYQTYMDKQEGSFYCNINGNQYIAYFNTLKNTGFKIIQTIPVESMYKDKVAIVSTFLIITLLFSLIAIFTSFLFSKSMSKPVNKLSGLMKEVEKGNRNVSFDMETEDEIGKLGGSFNNMLREINRLIEEVYVKQYLLKEAEFKNLKAQVEPHFLYNTLESINWMAKLGDVQGVSDMVTALGKFLRYSISQKSDIVPVREDIKQIKNYLSIQKARYGDKFEVYIEIQPEIMGKKIMRLLLQPLVENAIVHGLESKRGKGKLIIKGYKQEDVLCFEVIDDGIGMGNSSFSGEGIGMQNVNKRIKIHYGEQYGITTCNEDGLTCVKIIMPDNEETEDIDEYY